MHIIFVKDNIEAEGQVRMGKCMSKQKAQRPLNGQQPVRQPTSEGQGYDGAGEENPNYRPDKPGASLV